MDTIFHHMKIPRKAGPAVCLFLCLSVATAFSLQAEELQVFRKTQPHMGTEFTLQTYAPTSDKEAVSVAFKKAFARVEQLNQIASDYLPESEILRFAKTPVGERFAMSADLFAIFTAAESIATETDGAFDVTAGPFVRLWRLSRKNRKLPDEEQISRARSRIGFHLLDMNPTDRTVVKLSEGMLFDLGGIAKGYAADEALRILKDAGFPMSLVAASGDIVVGDSPPGIEGWTIKLKAYGDKSESGRAVLVRLSNAAVSTSGDARQYIKIDGKRYSHIVSTRNGLGLTESIAASVIAPNAMLSDAYATTVVLLGKKEGLQFIENKREIECRIVALRNGQEVAVSSHGFIQFQEEENPAKSSVTAP